MGNPHPHIENLKSFTGGPDPRRAGNGRKPTKFLTELLTKELKGNEEIIVEGIDIVTGKPAKVRVPMPTQRQIVQSLLRQAKKGNMIAIKEVFYRMEGNMPMPITGGDGEPLTTQIFSDTQLDSILSRLNGKAKTTNSE